jgi:hypothetical protein
MMKKRTLKTAVLSSADTIDTADTPKKVKNILRVKIKSSIFTPLYREVFFTVSVCQ